MLTLSEIRKTYAGRPVLDGVCLSVRRGECICIAGANSEGKTTLLSIAAGLLRPDSGVVERDAAAGCVPQRPALLAELTVRDNLRLWYSAAGRPVHEIFAPDSVETALGLAQYANVAVSKLSGGMARRCAICAALCGRPGYLLLDEPFTGLDVASCQSILAQLSTLKSNGVGILLASHLPSHIGDLADRVLLLRDGGIRRELTLGDLHHGERVPAILELLTCG